MSLEISRLLKEKEILLKEVHHRIKNNMSTLMSIFELHAYTLKDKSLVDALQDASSRVRSICTLYDKLYCSEDFEEVSIKNYLETLVDQVLFNFPASSQIKLKMEFKDFKISARMSFNLGIIVNEILTNTMKYAFNGRNSGTITISAFRKGGDAVITIQDDGVGIPEDFDIAKSTGFGMRLVRMMSQNIQGTIKAERNNGTKFTLEFSI
jgi:two-component sensor histidine kinase